MDSYTRPLDPAGPRQITGDLATAPSASDYPLAPTRRRAPAAPPVDLVALADDLRRRYPAALPLALVAGGALLFLLRPNYAQVVGAAVPLALGMAFLYVYFRQGRQFGYLVPGAILAGLGLGSVLAVLTGLAGLIAVGFGFGFLGIWYQERRHWWALLPGSLLALIGAAVVAANSALYSWALPLLLVVAGLWLLVRRWRAGAA